MQSIPSKILAAAVTAAVLTPGLAVAQNALEEVVVTATKRNASLSDLSVAANVIGADAIGPGGVQTVRDMYTEVPNMSIGDQFGFARIFMRGIGMTSIDIGGEGAVSILQDGAIIPRPAAQLVGMFDLEQLEVLRGPQGTLYGRGATAGAINAVTAKPGDELGGYINLTAGNYSMGTLEGAVDLPITDSLALRLATKIERRDGYGTNLFTGNDVDDRDAEAYRATLSYNPDANWDATLSYQYYEEDDNNYAFHYFGPSAGTAGGLPPAVTALGGSTIFDVGGSPYDIYSDQEAINTREGFMANMILNFEFSENVSLRSTTSAQNMERFLRDDLDSTEVDLFGQNNYTEESDSFGQEFTFNVERNNYSILAGAMYFEEELFGEVFVPLTNFCFFAAPATCGTPIGDFLNSGKYLQDGNVDITAYAAFVEVTVPLSEQFTVIAGARYNYEEREGTGAFIFDAAGINVPTDAKADWDDITPRVTLEYRPNDDTLMYATYNQAFKSGVINTGSLSPPLDPETVDAFELGYKGSSSDGRLNYSLAAFFYDYQNVQISFVDETSTVSTVNAAEAENYGAELELTYAMTETLTVDLFATYLSAEYKEFINGDYANGFTPTDLSGNTLPNAPEYTFKLGVTYQTALGDGNLRVRGEGYYQDDVYFTEWNRSDAFQEGYGLINANADYSFGPDGRLMLSLWGRNLSDEEVISNNIITAPLYNSLRVGSMLPPRSYGLTGSYSF
ncbi:TonB-dependent receptor [Congregibacter sp.]|uniref:TonB-dependent receptor n=1 Tax=Congregibacter sp. TaxID=2744308 RepID=UPI0039E4871F